jgi:hypothetical protein
MKMAFYRSLSALPKIIEIKNAAHHPQCLTEKIFAKLMSSLDPAGIQRLKVHR